MGDGDSAGMEARIAAAVAAAVRNEVAAISIRRPAPPTITIATLFAEFEKTRASDRSWRENRNRLTPLVRRLGALPAANLTPLVWAEHRAARAGELNRFGTLPKPHTLSIELGRAKELLKFGVTHGFLETSPLAAAKREKTISARETWLDEDGVQALLGGIAEVPGERPKLLMRAFVLLCLDGMLRFNEARNLRRDRIRDGVIELSAKAVKSKRRRIVGLTPRTLDAIAEVPPVIGDPRVFVNPTLLKDGTRKLYSATSVRYWFRIACVASKVDALAADGERVVIHTLRHSGASAADARGASAMAIKEALGHSSLAITERYLHRHREAGARELAKLMAEGAERERRGPKTAPREHESDAESSERTSRR